MFSWLDQKPTIDHDLADQILAKLGALSPEAFVDLIAEHLKARSDFSNIEQGPRRGSDRNVDISAYAQWPTDMPRRVIFQCKRYASHALNADSVNDVFEGLIYAEAAEGVLVSTRDLTEDGRNHVEKLFRRGILIAYRNWCGRGLAETLASKTPDLLVRHFPELASTLDLTRRYQWLCPSFEIVAVPSEPTAVVTADSFYNGYPPNWGDLAANFDIDRLAYVRSNGIRQHVFDLLGRTQNLTTFALIGVGGTGKTTLLRRLGFDAARAGFTVLRLSEDWSVAQVRLSKQIGDVVSALSSVPLVLIDNAADLALENSLLEATLRELNVRGRGVVLALADQPDRWNAALRRSSFLAKGDNYFAYHIHHLVQRECEALVDKILLYEDDKTLTRTYCALSRDERLRLCERAADRQMLVALLQMRHGAQFRHIIQREYDLIPMDEVKLAYSTTCYFNTLGIELPKRLIMRCAQISSPNVIQEFVEGSEGLFVETRFGLNGRHSIINKIVARYALSDPDAKEAVLASTLSALDLRSDEETRMFLRVFANAGFPRRVFLDLDRKTDRIRGLFARIRAAFPALSPYYMKFICTTEGRVERLLGDSARARAAFAESISLDTKYSFGYRQYAWLEHFEGNWERAAALIVQAARLAPDHNTTTFQAARLLSLNTVANFQKARQYYERAVAAMPENAEVLRRWDDYQSAEIILGYLSGLQRDSLIPAHVFKEMRPGIAFLRALHGPKSNQVRDRLTRDLRYMEQQVKGELGDLYEMLAGIDAGRDPILKALITCNVARLQYLEWYHKDVEHDVDKMELLFQESLRLNKQDPFTHCWYGTFLKEIRGDFKGARIEYDKARQLGNQSKNTRFHEHPLFLNNIGLLLIGEVEEGGRPVKDLYEAEVILRTAVAKLEDGDIDFYWPKYSLSLCNDLIEERGLNADPDRLDTGDSNDSKRSVGGGQP